MDEMSDLSSEFYRLRVEFEKTKNYAAALARGFFDLRERCPEDFVGTLARNGLSASHIEKVLTALADAITEDQRNRMAAAAIQERAAIESQRAVRRIAKAKEAVEQNHRIRLADIAATNKREAAVDRKIAALPSQDQARIREFRARLMDEAERLVWPIAGHLMPRAAELDGVGERGVSIVDQPQNIPPGQAGEH